MTVPTSTAKSGPYAGAGTTGPFTVGFRFLENSHLQVIRTSTIGVNATLALTTDYTVSGAGGLSGTVTLVVALATGEKLTIIRAVPFTQDADYVQNDAFPAESHERALDKLTMQTQQLDEEVGRALTLPATSPAVSTVLPDAQANKLIGWNSTATGLANLDAATLATIVAYGTANGDIFTGDGTTTEFNLTASPGVLANLDIAIGGVTQLPGVDYFWVSGTVVTFAVAPVLGVKILARYLRALPQGASDSAASSFVPAGAGAVTRTAQEKMRESVSVKDFGAVGDGVTDDTAAIQAALSASTYVLVPPGNYKLSATLTMQNDTVLLGTQPVQCVFSRSTVYGDTVTVGTASSHAGAIRIEGIWFNHTYAFNNGSTYVAGTSTNITNKDPTAAHVRMTQGQHVRIRNCWFAGVGYGIDFIDTNLMWVENCLFGGMWDANVAGLQDSTASIYCRPSTNICTALRVTGCWVGGYGAAAATNVTTPPGGGIGSVTVSKTLNAGPRYGIWIKSSESFTIENNYIGGQSGNSIYLSATAILSHGRIAGNMMDAASDYSILIESQSAATWPNLITIEGNTGVGYGLDKGFLWIKDTGQPRSATFITMSNNIVQYYYRCALRFEKVKGLKLSGNTVAAYNSDAALTTANDPYSMAGAIFDVNCTLVDCVGNSWGGAINDPTGTNYCKWGPYFYAATGNSATSESGNGLGNTGGSVVGGFNQTPRITSYTNSLGADVALNNTGTYFDGPSVAQGTLGTWFATGTVSVIDTVSAATFRAKLWDGTTLIASAVITTTAASQRVSISLSGVITNPAGNIRISVMNISSVLGYISWNGSGQGKDCTVTALQIA